MILRRIKPRAAFRASLRPSHRGHFFGALACFAVGAALGLTPCVAATSDPAAAPFNYPVPPPPPPPPGTAAITPHTAPAPTAHAAPAASAASATTAPALHTFTSTDGKSFKGTITNVSNDTVYLKRDDGEAFHSDIFVFSPTDQTYIRQWAVQQALQLGTPIFEIKLEPEKSSTITTKENNGTLTQWQASYQVSLSDQTSLHLINPVIQYIIFYSVAPATGQTKSPAESPLSRVSGTATVSSLSALDTTVFETSKVSLRKAEVINRSYVYSAGGYSTSTTTTLDEIKGIWLRIYDANNQLVQEWASDPSFIKNETWTLTPPRGKSPPTTAKGATKH